MKLEESGKRRTNNGANCKYALPITMPTPWFLAAPVVRKPALQTCEQRPGEPRQLAIPIRVPSGAWQ